MIGVHRCQIRKSPDSHTETLASPASGVSKLGLSTNYDVSWLPYMFGPADLNCVLYVVVVNNLC